MTEAELIDAILRQSVELQRLSQGEEAKAAAILSALEDDLRALLTQGNLSDKSKREIEALIKEAHKAITGQYVNIAGVLDLEAVVQHVADQTVDFLDDTFPIAIGNPSIATLQSLSRDILIDGSPASAWWAKQAEDTAFKFAGNVRRGVLEGKTNEQIVRDVVADMDVSRRNARTLVHSSIMTAANQARLATYKKNMKGAMGVKWLATLDSHTCHTCANLDGSEWDFDGKKLGKTRMEFKSPPAHFSCFPADTLVTSRGAIAGVSKRWFDGELIVIKTASGLELSCTPNHPILTDRGWVGAGALDVGCNVVSHLGSEWEGPANGNGNNVPTRIHDVVESFLGSVGVETMPVPVSPEDFHGDGSGSDIAVIGTDSLLGGAVDTALAEPSDQPAFVARSLAGLVPLSACGHFAQGLEGHFSPPRGGIRGGDLGFALDTSHSRPFEGFGLRRPTPGDTGFTQDAGGDDALNPVFLGDGILGHSGNVVSTDSLTVNDSSGANLHTSIVEMAQRSAMGDASLSADFRDVQAGDIELDEIVDFSRTEFSGHVYNLETSTGWYVAQGVVVHNCRCIMTPVPNYAALNEISPGLGDRLKASGERASSNGPVKSGTTFADFLKRQPDAWVREYLGAERAELYLSGKITLSDLVTKGGREKTLEELAR